jgi:uncharacterized protein YecE (DUF72 family)
MGDVRVGTCSWTDRALVASGWYPRGLRDAAGRLKHYAGQFAVVEADATYYGLPTARTSALWAERTPAGFRFDVKAFSLLTGHPTRPQALPADLRDAVAARGRAAADDDALLDEVWRRFATALAPLRAAGRLGAVLFQFPPWLAPGPAAAERLRRCRERTAGWPVAMEFRHPGWWQGEQAARTAELLTAWDVPAVAVDMAQGLPASVPPVAVATSARLAVVRFHGRSTAWGSGTKEDRFRHRYTPAELAEWTPRVRALAERADEVHVLFNNCCADAAVTAARTMADLLDAAPA